MKHKLVHHSLHRCLIIQNMVEILLTCNGGKLCLMNRDWLWSHITEHSSGTSQRNSFHSTTIAFACKSVHLFLAQLTRIHHLDQLHLPPGEWIATLALQVSTLVLQVVSSSKSYEIALAACPPSPKSAADSSWRKQHSYTERQSSSIASTVVIHNVSAFSILVCHPCC